MKKPLVSIIVPCFNASKLLRPCLSSLLKQTYKELEILLIDDKSTDNSVGLAKKMLRERKGTHVIENITNYGPSVTRNNGIQKAKGELIAFFETDMQADKFWIEECVKAFKRYPEVGAIHGRVIDLRVKSRIQTDGLYLIPHTGWVVMKNYGVEVSRAPSTITPTVIGSVGTVARKKALIEIGGFDEKLGHKVDDLDMGWRLWIAGYSCISIPTAITYHWGMKPDSARPISSLQSEIYFNRMTRVFLKNYELKNLLRYFPWQLLLYGARAVKNLFVGDINPFKGYIDSLIWTVKTLPDTLSTRRSVQSNRKKRDDEIFTKVMVKGSLFNIWKNEVVPLHKTAHTVFLK